MHFWTLSILSGVLILLLVVHVLWISALMLLTISHVNWRHSSARNHWMGGLIVWRMASIMRWTLSWITSTARLLVTFIHAILSHRHLTRVVHWWRSAILVHLSVRVLTVLLHSIRRRRLTRHSWWTTHVMSSRTGGRHHRWHTSMAAVLTSSTSHASSSILLRLLTLIPCSLRSVVHLDWSSKNLFSLHLLQGAFRFFF